MQCANIDGDVKVVVFGVVNVIGWGVVGIASNVSINETVAFRVLGTVPKT